MLRRLLAVFISLVFLYSVYFYFYENKKNLNPNNTLTVYTYSSFASSWGPGPELKTLFNAKTGIDVNFVDVGEAGVLLQRIALEKNNPKADLILGLDQFTEEPSEIFAEISEMTFVRDEMAPSGNIQKGNLIAYNWAPMTFIYRKSDNLILPKKIEDFAKNKLKGKIILLDPNTSTPGYIFFHWLVQKLGKESAKAFLESLKPNIYTVTSSWSAGYGMFKKKQSDYVFSYLTSPVYHWIEEKNFDYQPVYLEEEIPYHIEYAGILKSSKKTKEAQEFLNFIMQPDAQKIIMNKNYMLPITGGVRSGSSFESLEKVKLFEAKNQLSREEVLKVWKSISW